MSAHHGVSVACRCGRPVVVDLLPVKFGVCGKRTAKRPPMISHAQPCADFVRFRERGSMIEFLKWLREKDEARA